MTGKEAMNDGVHRPDRDKLVDYNDLDHSHCFVPRTKEVLL